MNATRSTVALAATVALAVLLVTAAVFPRLGPAHTESLPRPEPGVLAVAVAAAPTVTTAANVTVASRVTAASAAAVRPIGGVPRDTHCYAYLGKQQAILEHLDRAPRFGSLLGRSARSAVVNGVPRVRHGRAYLGKQQAILEHLGP
jgi:hypothetical protein